MVDRICVLAADISPIDVISHLPVMCEDENINYCYVPSKVSNTILPWCGRSDQACQEDLGTAGDTKRPTSCVFLSSKAKKGDNAEL